MSQENIDYSDRRCEDRTLVDARIEIFDLNAHEPIGVLMDLSASGFMISTDRQIEVGTLHQLCFVIPNQDSADDQCILNIGAETSWAQEAPDGTHSWMGFHIIDISDEDSIVILKMIASWQSAE